MLEFIRCKLMGSIFIVKLAGEGYFTASTYSAASGVKPKKPRKPLHQMAGFKPGIWDAGLIKLI
jgi:hypothetical protein